MHNSSEVNFRSIERTKGSACKEQDPYGDSEVLSGVSKRRVRTSTQWQNSGGPSLNRIGQKTVISGEQTIGKSRGGKNDIWQSLDFNAHTSSAVVKRDHRKWAEASDLVGDQGHGSQRGSQRDSIERKMRSVSANSIENSAQKVQQYSKYQVMKIAGHGQTKSQTGR